jgi:hypothetical protein
MRALSRTLPVVLAVLAASCGEAPEEKEKTPPVAAPPADKAPAAKPPATAAKPEPQVKRELPKFPPLTEEVARRVLRGELDRLGGDDVSRQALLYLADLGDRSVVGAIHDKLLAEAGGKFEDLPAAAIGAEASLVFGEPGAAQTVLKVAKQYADEQEDADEFLVRALARVDGPERAAATAELVKIATLGDPQIAVVAVQALAKNAAKEARETFLRFAKDESADGKLRGAAVAGLFRIEDPAAKELADKLVAAAGVAESAEGPEPQDVVAGFGVEGAVEVVPYLQKLTDAAVAQDSAATIWVADEATAALVRIHANGGGTALVPWLKALAKKSEGEYEDAAAYTLWAFGDEGSAAAVAKTLEGSVATWATPNNMEPAVDILDTAARLGTAAKPPLRALVDSAAQIDPAAGAKGLSVDLVALNLAAAHAFLKSGGK